jgi:mannosyltransferase
LTNRSAGVAPATQIDDQYQDGTEDRTEEAPPEQRPRWVVPVVAALSALALVVRALIALHGGLWRDEALFLFIAREPSWGAMLDFLRQHESHPPLFYAVMRVWLSLVGDSDATALAVPVVLGAALVPALYSVGSRLLSWRVGLLAAALATVSPIAVEHAAMVRPYSLLPLLALVATYALVRAIDLGGWRRWAGYAAATLALVYTHNWAWLVLGAQWVALAACLWRGGARRPAAILREWCLAQAAITLGFLPWLPSFINQAAHAGHAPLDLGAVVQTPWDVFTLVIVLARLFLAGTLMPAGAGTGSGLVIGWALIVGTLTLLLRRPGSARGGSRVRTGSVLPVLVAVPTAALCTAAAVSVRSDLLQARCILTVAPLLLLLVAYGFERLRASGQGRLAGVAAVVLLAAYAGLLPQQYTAPRSNVRELTSDLAAKTSTSDLILIAPEFIASSFNRYYSPATEQIDFPAMGRIGAMQFDRTAQRFGDPAALAEAERRLAATHAAGRRVWLIVDVGGSKVCTGGECDSIAAHSNRFLDVGYARASQLRAYLGALYGPPTSCDARSYASGRDEALEVCLFAPR